MTDHGSAAPLRDERPPARVAPLAWGMVWPHDDAQERAVRDAAGEHVNDLERRT